MLKVGISGLTSQAWQAGYANRTGHRALFGDIMASQSYDAIWTIALALNSTLNKLIEMGKYEVNIIFVKI